MIRFVAVASMRRGAIEPGEVLEPEDQRRALARLEHDGIWELHESVVWRGKEPVVVVGRPLPGCSRRPPVSTDILRAMCGQWMDGRIVDAGHSVARNADGMPVGTRRVSVKRA